MTLPASDNFNRTDGGLGANWTTVSGQPAPQLGGYKVTRSADSGGAFWSADSFNADQYSEIEITNPSTYMEAGPLVRVASGAATYYWFMVYGDSSHTGRIYKCVAGTHTQIGGEYTSLTVSANSKLKIRVEGTTITPSVDGVDLATRTDSDISSGSAGFRIGTNTTALDNWTGGNMGTSGPSIPVLQSIYNRKRRQ